MVGLVHIPFGARMSIIVYKYFGISCSSCKFLIIGKGLKFLWNDEKIIEKYRDVKNSKVYYFVDNSDEYS